MVKARELVLTFAMFTVPALLCAQGTSLSAKMAEDEMMSDGGAFTRPVPAANPVSLYPRPFSRVAFGGGVSAMGVNLQAATNLNRFMNLRTSGNILNYSANNISTNGLNLNAKANLSSAGTSLDFYPFPNHGFRISPGALIYNKNAVNAAFGSQPGASFTVNGTTYYASSTNPVRGNGQIGLHSRNQAFTLTTGWGNMIPRRGGHWSFPIEVGAAFVGAPTVNAAFTSGQVCDAQGQNCVDVTTDADVQANLQAELAKYRSDLNALKTYPILSFGAAYSFGTRSPAR